MKWNRNHRNSARRNIRFELRRCLGQFAAEDVRRPTNTGNFNRWDTTDMAIGGGKRGKQTSYNFFGPVSERMAGAIVPYTTYSKPRTAEDGLPQPGKRFGVSVPSREV